MSTKRRRTPGAVSTSAAHLAARGPNVVDFRLRVLPRHMELVARWLEAGRVMGLCDAQPYRCDPRRPGPAEHVVVWVRESADPAYMVAADGLHWTVTDCVRDLPLARLRSFEEALHFIRPVLPLAGQPAWSPAAPSTQAPDARRIRAARMSSPIDHA